MVSATHLVWSKERDEVFFLSLRPSLSIVAASVQTSPGFSRGVQEALFPITEFFFRGSTWTVPYDLTIMPDGERFVFVKPVDQEGSDDPVKPRIHVILNWFEELKERVPVD